MGRRRSERYDERLGEIADIATRLFADKGYHATSMQDLTEAVGLQRGALYHYISAKKDLLYLIHDRYIQPLLASFRAIEAAQESPEIALRALTHALMHTIHGQRDQVTVFLHEWKSIRSDDRWEEVRASRQELEDIVERTLRRGIEQGVFDVDNVQVATLGFFGMINYGYTWINPDGPWTAAYLADQFYALFLGGVARDGSRDGVAPGGAAGSEFLY
jgi:TetR/AcrR family transcriptional regulator, cholesterol catabolism regulator